MRRQVLSALLLLSFASRVRAGNDDGILVGGQAALTGGAITAITSDGAAAWYNPAGLARVTRHSFDINASAYGFSLYTAHKMFRLPSGQSADARVIDWQLVPSALSYTRVLSERVVGSFGVFIPTTTDADLRSSIREPSGRRWTLAEDDTRNEYDYIASVGIRVRDNLRVGVALHGIYVSEETMVQVGAGTPGNGTASFTSYSEHEARGDYGLRIGVGVQWTVNDRLELGLSMQTPTLTGLRKVHEDSVEADFNGMGNYESHHVHKLSAPWELSTPFNLRLGAAYRVGPAQVLVDGTLSSPLNAAGRDFDRRISGNVRVGALVNFDERFSCGLGLFSDRNGLRDPDANYVGLAGGVRIASNYLISQGARELTFATTLAARYAYGFGYTDGVGVSSAGEAIDTRAPLHVHELAFNLGGSVTF